MLVRLVAVLCLSLLPQERIPFDETKPSGERVIGGRITLEDGREVLHGPFQSFHANGKSESKGEYERGRRTGAWEFRGIDGKMLRRGQFKRGLEEGTWVHFHGGTTSKASERTYRAGMRCGTWTFWNEEGKQLANSEWKIEEERDKGRVTAVGARNEGKKDGPWVYRWPNGVARFLANYVLGELRELYFVHADGTYDPGWLSTPKKKELPEWAELRIGVADAEVAPEPVAEAARATLTGWLSEDGAAVPDTLLERNRELVPAALEEFAHCDLAQATGLARARRLHELLRACFGGMGWTWSDAEAPLLARRWKSAWSLLADDASAWEIDFHPRWRWLGFELEESRLGRPPQLLSVRAIGGRFGGRFGGTTTWPAEELARTGRWLVARQGEDGLWHETPGREQDDTALALLVLFGDANFPRDGAHSARVRAGLPALHERLGPGDGAQLDIRTHALHLWLFSELHELEGGMGLRAEVERLAASLLARADVDGAFAPEPENDALARYALVMAHAAGCKLDKDLFARFLGQSLERGRSAATSLSASGVPTRVSIALLVHLFAGEAKRKEKELEPIVAWLSKNGSAPTDSPFDLVFALWAARQIGKPAWPLWEPSWSALKAGWRKDGSHPGSAPEGTSLFEATCMAALAAQAQRRTGSLYPLQR